jgi:hypothetical protein
VASDLHAFVTARLDEDERVAREAIAENDGEADWQIKQPDPDEPSWRTPRLLWLNVMDSCDPESMPPAMAEHIALHDPERVLRRVAADRRILDLHRSVQKRSTGSDGGFIEDCQTCEHFPAQYPCATIRLLALPYADRPGYREEWRP